MYDEVENLIMWSAGITKAAANMLNRGGDRERIELRQLIDEWLEKYEPEYDRLNKEWHNLQNLKMFYLEIRGWEYCGDDLWRHPENGHKYDTANAMLGQIIEDDRHGRARPGRSEIENMRYAGQEPPHY